MKKRNVIGLLMVCICLLGFTQPTNSILIQAEDFTLYDDTSPGNYDLVYRTDVDVDMNYDHDPYWYEGIRVMAIQEGEELTYTIEVPVDDTWDITFNGIINFDLYIDYETSGDFLGLGTPLDFRGDFRYNQDIVVPGVFLTAGTHTITIVSNSQNDFGDVQLDYIWFASTSNPPDPLPVAPQPYDDATPPEAPIDYVSPVSQYGQLYVDGPQIKSSVTGENEQLRFVAISSSKWFPTIKNNTIYNLAYHEKVDGIRLAMYAEYGTYDDQFLRPYLQEKTLEVINECIDAGIYCEISFHTHATDFLIGGPAYDVEMDFYNWLLAQPVVAQAPPNLIFGIINEIASDTISWNEVKQYAQTFVSLIRTTHPENIILCGTPFWSQNPQDVIDNELAGNNIVYTFHMYTAEHQMSLADTIITCYDEGIPLWANEISPGHYNWKEWSYNFDNFTNLIYILESRGIPWTNWAWTLKGEALSALYWHSQYYGPWKNSELTEGGKFIRNMINDYLINTDFSDGLDGWSLHNWGDEVAEVEYLNEEIHIVHNGVVCPIFYNQQFTLNNIRVVNGITYTVNFDARAAAPRSLVVDVSEDGGDYTTYGSSGSLSISTTMTGYTFNFIMNDTTDDSARIVFNVGASSDDIWFDNITVQYSELEAPEEERDDVVVLNENFSADIDWVFNPWQPPPDPQPSAEIDYTDYEAHITFSALAEDPWGQQLSKGITLEQGASYIVSFDARSTAQRPLNVNIGNSVTYASHGATDVILSTHQRTYSFRFIMTGEATENDIIQFNLGTDTHDVWIDNVTIKKYNRLLNGDFSLQGAHWTFNPWEAPADIDYTGGEAHITFGSLAPHDYGQQLYNSLRLETGELYSVCFDARSTAPRPLKVLVTNNSYYYTADFILSETTGQYEYSFLMDSEATSDDIIRFDLGGDTNDVWLDNVVIRKSENLCKNGYFSNDIEPWSQGFYGEALGSAGVVNGELVVDVNNGGTESWNVQILQAGIEMNKGLRYFAEFDARTGIARDIEVNIGSGAYSNPSQYTSYSGAHIFSLDNEMRTYSFEFTMTETDHDDARYEFNLGLFDSDVILDNVRITEISKTPDDFEIEDDSGNWQGNGNNCFWNQLYFKDYILKAMDIQGVDGAMELRHNFDASGASAVKIDFSYYTWGYKDVVNYNWVLQFTHDGGVTWNTVFTWADKDLRGILIDESVVLDTSEYTFTDNCNFKFQSNGKNKNDDVFIDSVEISVYR